MSYQRPFRLLLCLCGVPLSVRPQVCSSGLKAIMYATQSIALGHHGIVVAGGMESMSQVPYYLPAARGGMRLGHGQVVDGVIKDGLWDPYNDFHMGMCAENTAAKMGFSRKDQDDYAGERGAGFACDAACGSTDASAA